MLNNILSSKLFLVYVNDSHNCLKTPTVSMFANDTNLTASGNTITKLHSKGMLDMTRGLHCSVQLGPRFHRIPHRSSIKNSTQVKVLVAV